MESEKAESRGQRRTGRDISATVLASRDAVKRGESLVGALRDMPLVIYGAGTLGRRVAAAFIDRGATPVAFADADQSKHGSLVDGIRVLSANDAVQAAGPGCCAIVAVWNPHGHSFQQSAHLLRIAGCASVVPLPAVAVGLSGLLPHFFLDDPRLLWDDRERIAIGYDSLADAASRQVFIAHLGWRLGVPWPAQFVPDEPQYFPEGLFVQRDDEVFVDCGAYDGDTVRSFIGLWPHFERCHAYEPDPENLVRLRRMVRGLPAAVAGRVVVHDAATSDVAGESRFEPRGDGGRVAPDGGLVVRTVRLDDEPFEPVPTMIKADVEGAEEATLRGARRLVHDHAPVLAVCVYHRPSDLWELPLLCRRLCGDYALHLRAHGFDGWETVLYAVPPGRSAAAHPAS